jgi:hypothetical protein
VPVNRYYYFVNTFDHSGYPIQVDGYVEADSELDAIQKVKDSGKIDIYGYEFLDLYVDNDVKR